MRLPCERCYAATRDRDRRLIRLLSWRDKLRLLQRRVAVTAARRGGSVQRRAETRRSEKPVPNAV